jgi:hypothetical protein
MEKVFDRRNMNDMKKSGGDAKFFLHVPHVSPV